MAIFATDKGFNILDDPNTGFSNKTPKKPKIWGYLFWIGLLLLVFIFLWSFTTHAQVVGFYEQLDTSTTTSPFISGGNIGQSNFTLNAQTSTTTISKITAHLKYNNSGNTGQTHSICVSEQVAVDSSWYISSPLGCLTRTIQATDFDTDHDFVFNANSSILLEPSKSYVFFNAGVATSTNGYDILAGINAMPSLWYGSPNDFAYGNDNLAGSAAFNLSLPSGLMYKNSPERPSRSGVADLFFIINFSSEVGGVNPVPTTCEGGGFFDNLLCNLYVSLFIPSNTALNQFSGLWDNIKNKPPFGYFVAISAAMSGIAVGTTTLAFAGISDISIFGTMRPILIAILWFLFAFWIFHRLRNFNF